MTGTLTQTQLCQVAGVKQHGQLCPLHTTETKPETGRKLSSFPLVGCQRFRVYADWKADNAHSSNLQTDSDWEATLEYLEDGGSRQVESVPPLPEPLHPPARQVMCHDSLASPHVTCSKYRSTFAFAHLLWSTCFACN